MMNGSPLLRRTTPCSCILLLLIAIGGGCRVDALSTSSFPGSPSRRSHAVPSSSPMMPHHHRRHHRSSAGLRADYHRYGRAAALCFPRGGGGGGGGRWASSSKQLFLSNQSSDGGEQEQGISSSIIEDDEEEIATTTKKQKKRLTREFFSIAIPAFVQLAAEPLAGLVDTAYLGRLGPEVLGGAGVAISAQYAIAKLYNDPLLRTSISLVASEDGRSKIDQKTGVSESEEEKSRALSIAVSSALLLAFSVGIIQLLLYFSFAGSIITGMGVGPSSPMRHSAYSYLRVRALGTPAATLWLVTNGVFRGLGDTSTPLKYSLLFTGLNAILDPLFIFTFKFGASGAAAGTAIAQYVALVPLILNLNRRVGIDVLGRWKELGGTLREYVKAGSYVFLRTVGKVLAYSVCARQAALLGSVAAAAYNLTFQLGFATTQICESVAVAVQTLLAREIAGGKEIEDPRGATMRAGRVRHLIDGSILAGGVVAGSLSLLTFLQRDSVLRGLTTDVGIREASRIIFPAVLATQVLKGLAYPVNGIIMGGLDWKFTMAAMWLANLVCVGMIQVSVNSNAVSLGRIWWALAAFMGTQVVTGAMRFQSKTGVWKILRAEKGVEKQE